MKVEVDTNGIVNKLIIVFVIAACGYFTGLLVDFQNVKAQGIENKKGIQTVVRLLCRHVIKNDDTICLSYIKKETP